ncbi:hypothetical protein CCP3SC15_1620006 [Gammaproteobacteria bacterium]
MSEDHAQKFVAVFGIFLHQQFALYISMAAGSSLKIALTSLMSEAVSAFLWEQLNQQENHSIAIC